MRNLKRRMLCALAILTLGLTLGCTIGPKIEDRWTFIYPGKPIQILSNSTVTGRRLDGQGGVVKQRIGGWIAMPQEHWEYIQKRLEELEKPSQ